jgi:hypothetical protein
MSGKAVRETLAALGVIASLVFVGAEIRQNTAVARGQTRQDLAALNQEWLVLHAADPEFGDLFNRAWLQEAELDTPDTRRSRFMMRIQLRQLENVYLQFAEGLVDESALRSYGLQTSSLYETERFRDFWITRDERRAYDPDFVRFFEERMGVTSP